MKFKKITIEFFIKYQHNFFFHADILGKFICFLVPCWINKSSKGHNFILTNGVPRMSTDEPD